MQIYAQNAFGGPAGRTYALPRPPSRNGGLLLRGGIGNGRERREGGLFIKGGEEEGATSKGDG